MQYITVSSVIENKMTKHFYALFALMLVILSACSDDDSFSASPSNLLTFSTDTVRIDTVFSCVPTATQTFWVYNRSGSGIRTNVRLSHGNQTGYRVNVDGVYLGPTEGFQVNDIEIRKNDSIRVFVELTSPENLKSKPTLVTDDLVFTLESGVQQKMSLKAYTWDAELLHDVIVSKDSTFRTDKPVVIYGGITVKEGATLTLQPGTTLYFHQDAGIKVYGSLKAEGTSEKNVTLRGDRIDNMFDYLPYDRLPGQWQGIDILEDSYNNSLNFVDLHGAYTGIYCEKATTVEKLKLSIYNSVIHNCQGHGLYALNSVIDIFNTEISNTMYECAALFGGAVMMRHCTLAKFYPFEANDYPALGFGNTAAGELYPLYQFDVYNTIVTGYGDDVVMGYFDDKTPATYHFDHCLLRTPQEKDKDGNVVDNPLLTDIIYEDVKDTTVAGAKNFKLLDTRNFIYDFRLREGSKAINAGVKLDGGYSDYDRLAIRRDDQPDMGAYEYVEQTETTDNNQ